MGSSAGGVLGGAGNGGVRDPSRCACDSAVRSLMGAMTSPAEESAMTSEGLTSGSWMGAMTSLAEESSMMSELLTSEFEVEVKGSTTLGELEGEPGG